MSVSRLLCWYLLGSVLALAATPVWAQASFQAITSRPFVVRVTPVIGPNGGVGGVLVDAKGVVHQFRNVDRLRQKWAKAREVVDEDVMTESRMRMISLSRLNDALRESIDQQQQPTDEMFLLAGLRRVEFVFVYPDHNDIVLAGPAGPWRTNQLGETVSVKTGDAIVRLDDLVDALRSATDARDIGITCSIEPTAEGLLRYAKVKSRPMSSTQAAVSSMERALGMQQVLLTGIPPDSHYASVMVAADYWMKRYAMGFDQPPVPEMPSYMAMLQKSSDATQLTSPRWWMTTNYEPLRRSPDALAWEIRGQGIRTLTEDHILTDQGQRHLTGQVNPLATAWAESMTENYSRLAAERSVFAQLRNCFDLSVVAALIAEHDLIGRAMCDLGILLDPSRLRGPRYRVPQSVPSKATMVRGQNGWLVSISGGVDVDSWSVISNTQMSSGLEKTQQRHSYPKQNRWWW